MNFTKTTFTRRAIAALIPIFAAGAFFVGGAFGADGQTLEQKAMQYLEMRQRLEEELSAVDSLHANDPVDKWRDAIRRWHEENAGRLAKQLTLAAELHESSKALEPSPSNSIVIPPNLAPEQRELLETHAAIEAAIIMLRQEHTSSSGERLRTALRSWQDENAAAIAAFNTTARAVTRQLENDRQDPPPVPLPANLGADATALLTEQGLIDAEIRQIRRAGLDMGPAQLRDVLRVWHERNANRLKEIRKLLERVEQEIAP